MELKTARLTLLIDPNKKAAFERLCAQQDLTASQVVRQMIRDYLVRHGVSYTPSGQDEVPEPAATPRSAPQGPPPSRQHGRGVERAGLSTIRPGCTSTGCWRWPGWLALGLAGVLALHRLAFVARVLFPLGGLLGLVLFGVALARCWARPRWRCCPSACRACRFTCGWTAWRRSS
jgi:hypothetical protein